MAEKVGNIVGAGDTAVTVFNILVWLWISNVVMLLGAELNTEIERGRQIEAGHPPEREPFLPVREAPKAF